MNIQSIIGKKIDQTQGFLEDGTRVPLSVISVSGNVVSQIKTQDHEGYNSIQLGFGINKRPNKPEAGHIKKAGLTQNPRFFREIRVEETPDAEIGSQVPVAEVFEPGDIVDVVGLSKGKGYAGVVKRWGFAGGPRTHGQSDRERAPGSIGQTTTPGRVYKGKKMAGNMGNERVTIKNLEVLNIVGDTIMIKGLVPGSKGGIVVVTKVGKNKKFMPLWSEKIEEVVEETPVQTAADTVTTPEEVIETPEETVETAQEEVKTAEENVQVEESTEKEEVKNEAEATEEVKEGEQNGAK